MEHENLPKGLLCSYNNVLMIIHTVAVNYRNEHNYILQLEHNLESMTFHAFIYFFNKMHVLHERCLILCRDMEK